MTFNPIASTDSKNIITPNQEASPTVEPRDAKIKRIAGIILIVLGLVIAAVAFGISYGLIPLPIASPDVWGIALGGVSIVCLVVGTILKNRNSPVKELPEEESHSEIIEDDEEEDEINLE